MTATAFVRVYNAAGTMQALLTGAGRSGGVNGFLELTWTKKRNSVGVAALRIRLDNPDTQYLTYKSILEVVRSDLPELAAYVAFRGFILDYTIEYANGADYLTVYAFDAHWLLSQRFILYSADVTDRTVFTSKRSETILKTLVTYNATSSATTVDGRDRAGAITGLTVQADSAGGTLQDYACTRKSLLSTLQDIQANAAGDFAVEFVTLTTYIFKFYAGQLGTDRSASVVFSLSNGNMVEPKLTYVRSEEPTVAVVGGQGESTDRTIRVVTGPNYSASNDYEKFLDGRRTDLASSLDGIGIAYLKANQANPTLDFKVKQTDQYRVDVNYFLGDKITASYAGYTAVQFVDSVTITYRANEPEEVEVVMSYV